MTDTLTVSLTDWNVAPPTAAALPQSRPAIDCLVAAVACEGAQVTGKNGDASKQLSPRNGNVNMQNTEKQKFY